MTQKLFLWGAVLIALLSGCASVPKPAGEVKPVDIAQQRDAELKDIVHWEITGRIGVQMPNDGFSAAMDWVQDGEAYEISLFDPLGRLAAHLKGDWDHVKLSLHDGRVFEAKDPDELMLKNLGWSLPVKSLVYWVRGLPDPQKVAWRREYDNDGRLKLLLQEGWDVRFNRYIESSRIDETFPALTKFAYKDFKVKLLIQEWN